MDILLHSSLNKDYINLKKGLNMGLTPTGEVYVNSQNDKAIIIIKKL
jgi:hypothetical protein